MPGTLGIAEQAILGSTLTWELQTEDEHPQFDAWLCWRSTVGHRITSQGDNPRYWTALDHDRRELGAGAGDLGLAKCIRLCERHHAGLQASAMPQQQTQPSPATSNDQPAPQNQQQSLL